MHTKQEDQIKMTIGPSGGDLICNPKFVSKSDDGEADSLRLTT